MWEGIRDARLCLLQHIAKFIHDSLQCLLLEHTERAVSVTYLQVRALLLLDESRPFWAEISKLAWARLIATPNVKHVKHL